MNKWLPILLIFIEKVLPIVVTALMDDKKKDSTINPQNIDENNEKNSDLHPDNSGLDYSSNLYSGNPAGYMDRNPNQ